MNNNYYDYAYFDGLHSNPHRRRCIDGSITGSGKCIGYCQFSEHLGFLTESLCKKHQCIEKDCHHFLPKQHQSHTITNKEPRPTEVVLIASELLSALEGIKVLRADKSSDGWKLNYITITNSYSIEEIEKSISDTIGENVTMVKLNYDFDTAVKIIFT